MNEFHIKIEKHVSYCYNLNVLSYESITYTSKVKWKFNDSKTLVYIKNVLCVL